MVDVGVGHGGCVARVGACVRGIRARERRCGDVGGAGGQGGDAERGAVWSSEGGGKACGQ